MGAGRWKFHRLSMFSRPWKILGLGVGTALVILAVLTVGFLIYMAIWGFTITITEEELQSALDKNLPSTESYELVDVTLKNGEVALEEGSSRIELGMEVDVEASDAVKQAADEIEGFVRTVVDRILDERGIEGSQNGLNADSQDGENAIEARFNGIIYISTEIGYDTKDAVIYLKNPRLEHIEVDGTPLEIEDTVNKALAVLGIALIDEIPVYDFNDNSIVSWGVKRFLKDLKVENGEVKVDIAL